MTSERIGNLVLTYAVHVLFQLINRLVLERRRPVVQEKVVYDGTTTNVSRN